MKQPSLFPAPEPPYRRRNTKPARPSFDGETFDESKDGGRLHSQLADVRHAMADGGWHTLDEIAAATGHRSTASVSARLRDLRKRQHGGHTVERRRRAGAPAGTWEYRLT